MAEILFAATSLTFEYHQTRPYKFSSDNYVKAVTDSLQKIAAISDLEVGYDKELSEIEVDVPIDQEFLEDGTFFPRVPHFDLDFSIRLPKHIQKQHCDGKFWDDLVSEQFKVYFSTEFQTCVAFIEVVNPPASCNVVQAATIVTNYLIEELKKNGDLVHLRILEPAPFQAQFILKAPNAGKGKPQGITFQSQVGRIFAYPHVEILSPSDAPLEIIFSRARLYLGSELDTCYTISLVENRLEKRWSDVARAVDKLTQPRRSISLPQRFRSSLFRGSELRDAHESIAMFEITALLGDQQIDEAYRSEYTLGNRAFVKVIADHLRQDRKKMPIETLRGLVEFSEHRRSHFIELLVVLFAAIVGGVAGSLATLSSSLNSGMPPTAAVSAPANPAAQSQHPASKP